MIYIKAMTLFLPTVKGSECNEMGLGFSGYAFTLKSICVMYLRPISYYRDLFASFTLRKLSSSNIIMLVNEYQFTN